MRKRPPPGRRRATSRTFGRAKDGTAAGTTASATGNDVVNEPSAGRSRRAVDPCVSISTVPWLQRVGQRRGVAAGAGHQGHAGCRAGDHPDQIRRRHHRVVHRGDRRGQADEPACRCMRRAVPGALRRVTVDISTGFAPSLNITVEPERVGRVWVDRVSTTRCGWSRSV